MAETSKVVDGKLELTRTGEVVVETLTREEVVGKMAEAQTKIDHLNIDLRTAQDEKDKWESYLGLIDANGG